MIKKIQELTIEGTVYVPKDSIQIIKTSTEGMPYVIIRTCYAGVHMGWLKSSEDTLAGIKVVLINSRRLYSWSGALTLSDLATIGTFLPHKCKFTLETPENTLIAIETLKVTNIAFNSLNSVEIWKL